jgi:inositol-phosphate phosphatase / L-galactose 1-phosphate phosphatase / histidinol-phosphatase
MHVKQALEFAQFLANTARPITLRYFRTPLGIMRKTDESAVTVVDQEIESTLRPLIHERFPHHGIIGEEYGSAPGVNHTWIIDPIDGTKSFIMGNPLFGTLIGLLRGDQPFIGVIDVPVMGERWIGNGKHTTFNDGTNSSVAMVSNCEVIEHARLYATSSDFPKLHERNAVERLSKQVSIMQPACDCYAYGLLASGHCDLVIEISLEPYDILPLIPVVKGAGGWMTDWEGNPLSLNSDGRVIAAASKALLETTIHAL